SIWPRKYPVASRERAGLRKSSMATMRAGVRAGHVSRRTGTWASNQLLSIYLAEIAPGNFSGHYSVGRGQKAWFLPAAHAEGACGAHAASGAAIIDERPLAHTTS